MKFIAFIFVFFGHRSYLYCYSEHILPATAIEEEEEDVGSEESSESGGSVSAHSQSISWKPSVYSPRSPCIYLILTFYFSTKP